MQKISIIMPTLNQDRWIGAALESALKQPELLELLIVDGGSTDSTLSIINQYRDKDPRVNLTSQPDNGPAEAINHGLMQCRGTIVGWLNSDDMLCDGALSRAQKLFDAKPSVLMIYGNAEIINDEGVVTSPYPSSPPSIGIQGFRDHCFICQPTVLWRRSMGCMLGPLDTTLETAFDFEYWTKAFREFPERIAFLDSVQAQTRHHSSAITFRKRDQVAIEACAIEAKIFRNPSSNRIHNYGLELYTAQLGLPAPSLSFHEKYESILRKAAQYLSSASIANLAKTWLGSDETRKVAKACDLAIHTRKILQIYSIRMYLIAYENEIQGLPGAPYSPASKLLDSVLKRWNSLQGIAMDLQLIHALNRPVDSFPLPIPALLHWLQSEVLQANYPLPVSCSEYLVWWQDKASKLMPSIPFNESGEIIVPTSIEQPSDRPEHPQFGVNLVGHAYEVLGIGEDIRMAAKALEAVGIPYCVLHHPAANGSPSTERSLETAVLPYQSVAPYAFNLICMAAPIHARWLCQEEFQLPTNSYTIAAWPWETCRWPQAWAPMLSMVQEVWASSQLIANALEEPIRSAEAQDKFPVEIRRFSMTVEIDYLDRSIHKLGKYELRKSLGLNASSIVFVFSFDLNSTIDRKNPMGALEAFQRAFPKHENHSVSLLIKCQAPRRHDKRWIALKKLAQDDVRIHIIESDLSREEILDLYACCDAFLSLHRSEGFGRCLAEALQLGLDVIATDYGGNTDFCDGPLAHPVRYKLVPIPTQAYPQAQGQVWAEPDLEHAASCLRQVAKIRSLKSSRDYDAFSAYYKRRFSAHTVGLMYKQRLEEIWKLRYC
ncbi:MAG: glycosyltransferase [Cyanobacteriota bacterium]